MPTNIARRAASTEKDGRLQDHTTYTICEIQLILAANVESAFSILSKINSKLVLKFLNLLHCRRLSFEEKKLSKIMMVFLNSFQVDSSN